MLSNSTRRGKKGERTNGNLLLGRNELLLQILLFLNESLESFDLRAQKNRRRRERVSSTEGRTTNGGRKRAPTHLVLSSSLELRQSRLSFHDSLPHPRSFLDEKIPFTRSNVDSGLLLADLGRPGFELLLLDLDLVGELGGLVCVLGSREKSQSQSSR